MGFTVFAGFKKLADNTDAEFLKEEASARVKVMQLDTASESQVLTTVISLILNT